MKKKTVFVSEDLPGVGVNGGAFSLLYQTYARLLALAVKATILARKPSVSVVASRFVKDLGEATAGSTRLLSFNIVTSKSLAHADVDPLIHFHRKLVDTLASYGSEFSRNNIEAVSNRVVLAGLLEFLARPAAAMNSCFKDAGAEELLVLSGSHPQERIAVGVASETGLSIRYSAWALCFVFFNSIKSFLLRQRDGLPSVERIAASYAKPSRPPGRAELIFFCIDERRIRRLTESIRRMARDGRNVQMWVQDAKKEVRDAMATLSTMEFSREAVNRHLPETPAPGSAQHAFEEAKKLWVRALSEPGIANFPKVSGIDLASFCADRFITSAAKFTVEAALFERAAKHLLEASQPRLVVLADNGLHSMLLLRLCEDLGVNSVFYVYNPLLFTVKYWPKLLFESMPARNVLTATSHMARIYMEMGGYQSERLKVIGDIYANRPNRSERDHARARLRERMQAPSNAKVVVALSFFVSGDLSESQKREFLRTVGDAVRTLPGTRLVVKAHPNEDTELLSRMLTEEGVSTDLLAGAEDLRALMLGADAACMVFSQAGMEILMLDVPLVIVQEESLLAGFEEWVPYVKEGAALAAPDAQTLSERLNRLLYNERELQIRLESAARFREKFITPDQIDPLDEMHSELVKLLNP